ncbi:putative membrane protein [Nonomuraea muscovyensis]|uniref:Putative membrane protein n=1 Tax=Nonomuraea muscovyensis TaxID=1124761 RepID=A0A7X0C024_9ACTN|nr:vitamin K epoxide reductase family protein [Nonomuraea muscovyensis]MBB6345883.1 putative membrane protein [Nonomuraea muscovyensis]
MRHSPSDLATSSTPGDVHAWPAPFPRLLPWVLLAGGAIGLLAAFVLGVEKIALLKDPAYEPSCSINPVLACGSIMRTPQAELLGFPNPLLGIAGFAIVTTVGAALLAGATFGRWFWLGLQTGVTAGVVFVHWLALQSLYIIGALCPYCMVVWAVTIPIGWYVTLHNAAMRHLPVPSNALRTVRAMSDYHAVGLTIWFVALTTLIGTRFWSYWSTVI